jgi:hypothetical protein
MGPDFTLGAHELRDRADELEQSFIVVTSSMERSGERRLVTPCATIFSVDVEPGVGLVGPGRRGSGGNICGISLRFSPPGTPRSRSCSWIPSVQRLPSCF